MKRCDAHPVTKRPCAQADAALETAADVSVLLTYHKIRDSLADEKGAKRALAAVLCRLGKRGYERRGRACRKRTRRWCRRLPTCKHSSGKNAPQWTARRMLRRA